MFLRSNTYLSGTELDPLNKPFVTRQALELQLNTRRSRDRSKVGWPPCIAVWGSENLIDASQQLRTYGPVNVECRIATIMSGTCRNVSRKSA